MIWALVIIRIIASVVLIAIAAFLAAVVVILLRRYQEGQASRRNMLTLAQRQRVQRQVRRIKWQALRGVGK